MKALQIIGPGRVEIVNAPVPTPGPGEVLLKVLAVTTCPHWDMHILGGRPMFAGGELKYPYTLGQPGHEACGEIACVGEGVTTVAPGDRVCAWIDPGHEHPGCYAQYVVKREDHVIGAPESLPPEACAPLELASCAAAYLRQTLRLDAIKGKRVGVFGLGPAGLVFVQLALAEGAAEVVGFDPLPERCEHALRLGAARALDPAGEEAKEFPSFYMPGCLNTSFDCVGSPAVVRRATELTSNVVSLFAVQREDYAYPQHCWGRMTLTSQGLLDRTTAQYVASLLADGRLRLDTLVTHTMPLQDYARAVDLLARQQALKVAFLPQES